MSIQSRIEDLLIAACKGGPGSGHFEHRGIPGHQGGSLPRGAAGGAGEPGEERIQGGRELTADQKRAIRRALWGKQQQDDLIQNGVSAEDLSTLMDQYKKRGFDGPFRSGKRGWVWSVDKIGGGAAWSVRRARSITELLDPDVIAREFEQRGF